MASKLILPTGNGGGHGSAVSLQLIGQWLHQKRAIDDFGVGTRQCRVLHYR
ncbi:hypothetical protein [Microcoleus sp. B9-D4]|uniref:hypothetical protein n=1 Tax=Microcoleus sp. B9-D4 TaxID=2818711 RepID=UPI002FD30D9F